MITAKELYKQVREHNPLFDEFVDDYLVSKFQSSFGKPIFVYFAEINSQYYDIFRNGSLKDNLEVRGFDVNVDQPDGDRFMCISIPPQGE
jgi:hypothetical protein